MNILNQQVKQIDNLYCLNDFHKISGNNPKHKPANFLRLEQTQELVKAIESRYRCSDMSIAVKSVRGGNNQGTFACKQLVYSYAMWVSAEFQLFVIETFDNLVNKELTQANANVKRCKTMWANDRKHYESQIQCLEEEQYYYDQELQLANQKIKALEEYNKECEIEINYPKVYNRAYLSSNDTFLHNIARRMSNNQIKTVMLRDVAAFQLTISKLYTDLRKVQNMADNIADKAISYTIYSHDLHNIS